MNNNAKKSNKAIFLFPPNWTACVSGPHLALPLIAGAVTKLSWETEVWDLSEEFYKLQGTQPDQKELLDACNIQDIETLDKLYFDWEDSYANLADEFGLKFGLLSGFSQASGYPQTAKELIAIANQKSPFTAFYEDFLAPRLKSLMPKLIGITIASQHQLLPAVELLIRLRRWLPEVVLVLGGNVITRLKDSPAFVELSKLANRIVLYQGEKAIQDICLNLSKPTRTVSQSEETEKIFSDELIPFREWPLPSFFGLNLGGYPGKNTLPYVSTRGCYWGRCPFCAIPAGWSSKGYAGSASGEFIASQLEILIKLYGIRRFKFVDEAFPPSKIISMLKATEKFNQPFVWEAYARIESAWEDQERLHMAYETGLRRLYFGLEIAPNGNRNPLGKNDKGNILHIMKNCKNAGILVHLFCMVGHPMTTADDAKKTVAFLIEHQDLIDTADLVGFRLDRGTTVVGVEFDSRFNSELSLSPPFIPTHSLSMTQEAVNQLEWECQEIIWDSVPRLLHPLYRIGNSWGDDRCLLKSQVIPHFETNNDVIYTEQSEIIREPFLSDVP